MFDVLVDGRAGLLDRLVVDCLDSQQVDCLDVNQAAYWVDCLAGL